MCDTLVIRREGSSWFAKNSDREPDEPQLVELHAPVRGDTARRLQCTHIEIEQVSERYGMVLSRPVWMWGAEMGVNTAGVVIGNEAVFSRQVDKRGAALLGMDLVRLGLERGGSARAACDVITGLIEQYGQGGPAGYHDKDFRYDNSFLIADANEALVLETAGRDWVVRPVGDHWAISNTYTVRQGIVARSAAAPARGFGGWGETVLRPVIGCARQRIALSRAGIARLEADGPSLAGLAAILRCHASGDGFVGGSNRDLCMHASGLLRPSHTTGSMIVKLASGEPPRIAVTGTKSPCISLFHPVDFDGKWSVWDPQLWQRGSLIHEAVAANAQLRSGLRARNAALEARILPLIEAGRARDAEMALLADGDQGSR
jgi:secernin